MKPDEIRRLVRETYPFPIALAHKKTLGLLDDNMEKLKNIFETAEAAVQFLALLALAQVRKDLAEGKSPDKDRLKQAIRLNQTSFGTWHKILSDVMKSYYGLKSQLIVPELFDFCFSETSDNKLGTKPIHNKALVPIRNLRNSFHHGRLPNSGIGKSISDSLEWLHLLLSELRFLSEYKLSFVRQTVVKSSSDMKMTYIHDLIVFNGCLPDPFRWQSEILLPQDTVIFLHPETCKYLILSPFVILNDQLKDTTDIFLMNNVCGKEPVYVSCQFHEEIAATDKKRTDGSRYKDAVADFLNQLDMLKTTPDTVEVIDISASGSNEKQDVSSPKFFEQDKSMKNIDSDLENKVSEIENLYENAEFQEAYRKFKALCASYPTYKALAMSFLARFNDLNNQIMQGIIPSDQQTIFKNQIGNGFQMCLKRFKEDILTRKFIFGK